MVFLKYNQSAIYLSDSIKNRSTYELNYAMQQPVFAMSIKENQFDYNKQQMAIFENGVNYRKIRKR